MAKQDVSKIQKAYSIIQTTQESDDLEKIVELRDIIKRIRKYHRQFIFVNDTFLCLSNKVSEGAQKEFEEGLVYVNKLLKSCKKIEKEIDNEIKIIHARIKYHE